MVSYIDHQILILDDQAHITFILKKFLEKQYKVLVATSIDEANTILSDISREISIAFIDFNLKDKMDGVDYAIELKSNFPITQVVMITGVSAYEIAIKALNSGVINALINKPFDFNEIQATVNENLEIWKQNYEIMSQQINQLLSHGEVDQSKLETTNLSISHLKKIINTKTQTRKNKKFDLLGFGITKGDKILMKYFFDKSIQSKYTPLFAKFIQSLSILNFDLFLEADNYKLEELVLEDISILFRSVNTLNYSVFIKGEPSDKVQLTEKVNQIANKLSIYSSQSNEQLTDSVKEVMINHFKEFKASFSYQ